MQKAEGQSSRLERHFYKGHPKNILVDFSLLLLLLLLPLGFSISYFIFFCCCCCQYLLFSNPLGCFAPAFSPGAAWYCLKLLHLPSPPSLSFLTLFKSNSKLEGLLYTSVCAVPVIPYFVSSAASRWQAAAHHPTIIAPRTNSIIGT